jgi:hypothetical protein
LLFLLVGRPHFAEAHTAGKMQLAAEPAGPYMMTVWTSPDPAEVGEIHVALALVMAEDASPILDADVIVRLTSLDGDVSLTGQATTENSENKFLYEAIFELDEPGPYQVGIVASGSDGTSGATSFELVVESAATFNWLYLIPIILGLAAVAFLFIALRQRPNKG